MSNRCPRWGSAPAGSRVWLDLTALGWASVLILGLGCWGVARVPASLAGVFLNLEPLVGALLGVLVLGEAWSPGTVVGGALIVGAAVVVSHRSST